jgi:predicted transcriptional regulator YheO
MTNRVAPDLRHYVPLLDFIATILGGDAEILLHDVRDVNHSIVAIVNGEISGRQVGGPATDLVLEILSSPELRSRPYIANYRSRSRSGVTFKSHTYIIRGDSDDVIGMLCINVDVRKWIQARDLLAAFTNMGNLGDDGDYEQREQLGVTTEETARAAIQRRIIGIGVDPSLMSVDERARLISQLDDDGLFLLKGTVSELALALGVSEATIYRQRTSSRRNGAAGKTA